MTRIHNPYFPHQHVKCTMADESVMVLSGSRLELPEDQDVLLTPIEKGRSDSQVIGPSKVFTVDFGLMDMSDWETRQKVKDEKKKLVEEQEAMAAKKAKEASERAEKPKKAIKEKPDKVVEEKPLDMGKKLDL